MAIKPKKLAKNLEDNTRKLEELKVLVNKSNDETNTQKLASIEALLQNLLLIQGALAGMTEAQARRLAGMSELQSFRVWRTLKVIQKKKKPTRSSKPRTKKVSSKRSTQRVRR